MLIERGKSASLERRIEIESEINAPVCAGDPVGALIVSCDGEEVGRVPIVIQADIPRLSFGKAFARLLSNFKLF